MASISYHPSTITTCLSSSSSSSSPPTHQFFLTPTLSSSSSSSSITRRRRTISLAITTTTTTTTTRLPFCFSPIFLSRPRLTLTSNSLSAVSRDTNTNPSSTSTSDGKSDNKKQQIKGENEEEVEEEVEEDLPWIQEKALDLVEFTGSVTQAIPGPRVGRSSLPWILALPLAYVGVTFVIAFVKTLRNFNSPRALRRNLVNKNAMLCKSIDELFEEGRDRIQQSALKELMQKTSFSMEEILRKYIRYAFNEKPFNPDLVANIIQLRKASSLDDSQVAEILNEISRRIVKDKGPVVMNMSGYSEKGFKRKLAVQALFGKVYYLSELPEFCSRDSSLIVKEIFGVADEDAEKLRLHALSDYGDVDSLEKMVDGSDFEDLSHGSSDTP